MPRFFRFIDANPDLKFLSRFHIRVGGGEKTVIVVDTGSKGIVIGSAMVPEGSYTVMDPQPPKPVYSSSGNSYEGEWVLAHVELIDRAGQSFTTAHPVAVFRSTSVPGVRMMGVGTRWDDPGNVFNPLLSLPEMEDGTCRRGYIVTREGVWFGYGEPEIDTFRPLLFPSTVADPAMARVELAPPPGSTVAPYAVNAPFLLDTGLNYMIVTPGTGQPLPPDGYLPADLSLPRRWVDGVAVSVSLEGYPIWAFNTSNCDQRNTPAYGRFGARGGKGVINTGWRLLAEFDLLMDPQGGQVGLRRPVAPPPHAVLPPDVNTSASPSAVQVDGATFVFYKGAMGDPGIYMTGTPWAADQGAWTHNVRLPAEINTSDAPSAVAVGDRIHVVYKGAGGDAWVYVAQSSDLGQTWSMTRLPAEVNTSTRPDAFVHGDSLYVVYKGVEGDERVFVAPPGGTPPHVVLPPAVNSSASPSAVLVDGATFVFYKGVTNDPGIYMTRSDGSPDQGTWTPVVRLPGAVNTSHAPSAVVINSSDGPRIYVVYKGLADDTGVYVARSFDRGATWSMTRLPAEVNTSTRPDAFVSGSLLYVVYKGSGDDARIYVAPLPIDTAWKRI